MGEVGCWDWSCWVLVVLGKNLSEIDLASEAAHVAVQAGRAVDLARDVLRGVALVQGFLEAMCREVEDPFRSAQSQGVKVGQGL